MKRIITKIITDDCVYVQKNDIAYLNHSDLSVPASIFLKVFGNGVVIIDDSNRYEFIRFDKPEEIDFFKKISFNYNKVKDLSHDEMMILERVLQKKEIGLPLNIIQCLIVRKRRIMIWLNNVIFSTLKYTH